MTDDAYAKLRDLVEKWKYIANNLGEGHPPWPTDEARAQAFGVCARSLEKVIQEMGGDEA